MSKRKKGRKRKRRSLRRRGSTKSLLKRLLRSKKRKPKKRITKLKKPKGKRSKKKKSAKQLWKIFDEICEWVKDQGCRIYKHKKLKTVNGSNGYFTVDPYPHIRMALQGRSPQKALQLVVHEFCHYWQWSENFLDRKDDDGNEIYAKLLDGEALTPREREKASKLVRISEYDCEKRTGHVIKMWKLEGAFPISEHRRSAATYNRHIVWSIGDKNNEGSGVFLASYDSLAPKLWGKKGFPRWMSNSKMLSPLSSKHKKIFDAALKASKRSKKIAARK
jgi:hypothetical protein